MLLRLGLVAGFLLTLATTAFAVPKFTIRADQKTGIYTPKDNVTWTVELQDGDKPVEGEISYTVKLGGLKVIDKGTRKLDGGKTQFTATREDAGVLLLTVNFVPMGSKQAIVGYGAAVFAPSEIKPSSPAPKDFDEFWATKIAAMQTIPMNATFEKAESGNPKIEYYKFTLDHVNGTKVYGQLAKPVGGKNLSALLQVQWAGVYGLQRDWVTGYAAQGWLAVNISAHNLPIDQPEAFYAEKAKKELNDYPGIGNDNRETSYFLPMFLSCRRAVDFITTREDWNGKMIAVHGGSQGGYQAIVTAALCPNVNAMAASVPAGCDHTGKLAGREPGWPNWASRTWMKRDEGKMLEAAKYFDAMHFASRVKCPSLVGVGLIDTVCPAEGIFATCNQLAGPKEIIIMPTADHGGDHANYHKRFGPFLMNVRSEVEKK
jgi:cephalosporin-C deacetylase